MNLADRWLDLCKRINAQGDVKREFQELLEHHSMPRRAYHNIRHVEDCIEVLDSARNLCNSPDEVEFALWYHDAIYDSQSKDNEDKSAELTSQVSKRLGLAFGKKIFGLILATKHIMLPEDIDAQVIVDVDLSILGRELDVFMEYEKNIRQEYGWVPEEAFREGRSQVLQSFLDRDSIYSTKYFQQKYESQARINLEHSLLLLRYEPDYNC